MIYFTSDLHLGHVKIFTEYEPGRAVLGTNVEEMTAGLIKRFNEVITPDDTCIIIGDFALGPQKNHKGYFDQLNGIKWLVRGNHDGHASRMQDMGFTRVINNLEMELDGHKLYLAHIPPIKVDSYEGRFYKPEFTPEPPKDFDFFLCGHVHSSWKRKGNIINVGCDVWDYRPVTLQQLLE